MPNEPGGRRAIDATSRAGLAIGAVTMLVGLAAGYAMLAFPGNLSPDYPLGVALLVPVAFIACGLLACAHALGRPRGVAIALGALAACLWLVANWGAFFSSHLQCRETFSFLGLVSFALSPSEAECADRLRLVMIYVDAIVLLALAVFAWRRLAGRSSAGDAER